MAKNSPCLGCGQNTNANGNCFTASCWNANDKRHDTWTPPKKDED